MTKPTAENIPVRTGDRLELTVERLNSSGDGIAKKEGYILFLPEALPGDQVRAEVVKTTPRFGVASVVERRRASPDRIEAPCPVFPRCGGCRFQDLNYQAQLDFKTQVVRDSLEHLAGLDPCPPLQTVAA
ncbi:MAG: TRAM domain-containing protein, partial [Nitrospinaceae bacterium]